MRDEIKKIISQLKDEMDKVQDEHIIVLDYGRKAFLEGKIRGYSHAIHELKIIIGED